VRELENTLRRAVVHSHGRILLEENLDDATEEPPQMEAPPHLAPIKPLDDVEKEHILSALRFAGGNRGKVCQLLGISRPTLQRKIRKYGIQV